MQTDTPQKVAPLSIALHWIVGIAILGMLAVGVYMHELPKGPDKELLYFLHKSSGFALFFLIIARIAWRYHNGFFLPAGEHKDWEKRIARYSHIGLLTLSLLMPLSGMVMTFGFGSTVPFFGLWEIGPFGKNSTLAWLGYYMHKFGALAFLLLILLHASAALKHHFYDKDDTLRRMLRRSPPQRLP